MDGKIGCPYRDFCRVYAGDYNSSMLFSLNFRNTCNLTPLDSFKNNICPIYDNYLTNLKQLSACLVKVNGTLLDMTSTIDRSLARIAILETEKKL